MKQKFLLASVIVLLFSVTTKAQIGKGSVWLGGAVGYTGSKTSDDSSTTNRSQNFSVNPSIGKAIAKNTVMGIDLLYSHMETKAKGLYSDSAKNNSYGAGIFIREYIPIINRLYVFGHIRAAVTYGKETHHYGDYAGNYLSDNKGWTARINIYPGVSFTVNKKLQLESGFNNLFNIQYAHNKTTTTASTGKTASSKSEQFSAGASLDNSSTFFIGFRLLLNNKS